VIALFEPLTHLSVEEHAGTQPPFVSLGDSERLKKPNKRRIDRWLSPNKTMNLNSSTIHFGLTGSLLTK